MRAASTVASTAIERFSHCTSGMVGVLLAKESADQLSLNSP